ncbi:MAG TPA: M48 family metalloprotease [Pyrinomonadaceae bacterium]
MYYLIGTSLLLTFMLAVAIASASVLSVIWKLGQRWLVDFRPETRARVSFMFRVMPIVISLTVGLAFVVPSFVLYEPNDTGERVGLKLSIIIAVAVFGISAAGYRIFASWWRTRRLLNEWIGAASRISIKGISIPVLKLRYEFPVFAVVGIWWPRLFIAEHVIGTLDEQELAAVLKHEIGHITALDNLKRLAMKLCGDLLVAPLGRGLDRDWTVAAEAAADEYAVASGDRSTALSLAGALIKIARIIPATPPPMPAVSYAYADAGEMLAGRIRRLIQLADRDEPRPARQIPMLVPASLLAVWMIAVFATDGAFLARIHNLSELVIALLQ